MVKAVLFSLIHWLANIEHYEAEALLALTLFNTGHDSVTDYTGNFTAFLEAEYEVTENPALIDIAQMNELTDFFINFGTDFSDSLHQDIFTSGLVDELPYALSTFRRVRNLADFFTQGIDTARYDDHPVFPLEVYGKKEKESVKDARARRRAAAQQSVTDLGTYTKAYPNPANRVVTVEYALPENIHHAELVISDLNGRVAYRKALTIKQYLYNIDVSEWMNGIYYYKISNAATQIGSGKIVVIK